MVITAFTAALFGGLLSPLISSGLARLSEYQIEWPQLTQRVTDKTRSKTKTKNKEGGSAAQQYSGHGCALLGF